MKRIEYILAAVSISALLFASCSDEWDKHYSEKEQVMENENLISIQQDILDYVETQSEYSSMYSLWEKTGVLDSLAERNQVFTMLAVNNTVFDGNIEDEAYTAKAYITDVAFSPANMKDGQRILMWNGKYLNIAIDEQGTISFNGSKAIKIIKLNDGYLYELDAMVVSPKALIEVIQGLSDEYSMFRDSVLVRNQKTFDRENSKPSGVDPTGNTKYDTVWITTNPYFAEAGLDIWSESITATVLIPSNELVLASWERAEAELKAWNIHQHHEALPDSVLKQWFFRATFFNKIYTKEDFEENEDLFSVFSSKTVRSQKEQWRTTVQQVDLDNPIEMSNGIAYYVTHLQAPKNVMIYRLKDYFQLHYTGGLTLEQKERFLSYCDNLSNPRMIEKQNGDIYKGYGPFPDIQYLNLEFDVAETDNSIVSPVYTIDFTAFNILKDANGNTSDVVPYLIPPGEYNFFMGLANDMKHDLQVYINDKLQYTLLSGNYSNFHYDRSGSKQPYGFVSGMGADNNYRKSGGSMNTVTFTGDEAVELKLTFICTDMSVAPGKRPTLHHWNLEPTLNCY